MKIIERKQKKNNYICFKFPKIRFDQKWNIAKIFGMNMLKTYLRILLESKIVYVGLKEKSASYFLPLTQGLNGYLVGWIIQMIAIVYFQ